MIISRIHISVLGFLCFTASVHSVPLSSSSLQEGEEEALKLWQTFCAGNSDDKNSNNGGIFVFCSPTTLNGDEDPEINLRLNHKVSPEEKQTQTVVETPKENTPAVILGQGIRNGTRSRGWRRRLHYARKNTIESKSKDAEQLQSNSPSEIPIESSTQISVTSSQNEAQTVSEKPQENSTVSHQRKRKKQKINRQPTGERENKPAGQGRVASIDAKPVSLFVSNTNTTTNDGDT